MAHLTTAVVPHKGLFNVAHTSEGKRPWTYVSDKSRGEGEVMLPAQIFTQAHLLYSAPRFYDIMLTSPMPTPSTLTLVPANLRLHTITRKQLRLWPRVMLEFGSAPVTNVSRRRL